MTDRLHPDEPYCPTCKERRYSFQQTDGGQCDDCGSAVLEDWPLWPRTKWVVAQAMISVLGLGFIVGLPLVAIWDVATGLLAGEPLLVSETVTKTVTETEYHGLLVGDGIGMLLVWMVGMAILWLAALSPRRV